MKHGAAWNYRRLGRCLEKAHGDLFRDRADGHGLIHVTPDGNARRIVKGADLAPLIVDRVKMRMLKEGKLVSELPTASHLNAMLQSETFLQQFRPLDEVAKEPIYLDDYWPNRGIPTAALESGFCSSASNPKLRDSTATTEQFLSLMDFDSNADRTNTVAAGDCPCCCIVIGLGIKPVVIITGTKSHSGKGTVTEFVRGSAAKADLLYESLDWPMQSQLQRQLRVNPQIAMIVLDNVRRDSAGGKSRVYPVGVP